MKNHEPSWTIEELGAVVANALAEGYDGPPNARVRDVPDRRTIRYYTTLGLIDRPAEMRGRTAYYGRRHLLQLVAIKKLQAGGRSLAEVQRALAGQTDQGLAWIAEMSDSGTEGAGARASRRATRDFWRQEPAARAMEGPAATADGEDRRSGDLPTEAVRPQIFHGAQLVEGVTLLLASSRPIEGQDLEAIRTAAAPLIDTLKRRQLIHPREEGEA